MAIRGLESPFLARLILATLVQFGADCIETVEAIDKLDIKNPKM
jgi:hypothetical protein